MSDESPEQYGLVLVSVGKDGSAHQAAWNTGKDYLAQLHDLMTRFLGPPQECFTSSEGVNQLGTIAEKEFIFLGEPADGA